jgi:hypothetical protein
MPDIPYAINEIACCVVWTIADKRDDVRNIPDFRFSVAKLPVGNATLADPNYLSNLRLREVLINSRLPDPAT